jgi:hypothetical protein
MGALSAIGIRDVAAERVGAGATSQLATRGASTGRDQAQCS